MAEYKYNFPVFASAVNIQSELKHAAGEIVEASFEPEGSLKQAIEILDAQECLENAWRFIDEETRNVAFAMHYKKNAERGYY